MSFLLNGMRVVERAGGYALNDFTRSCERKLESVQHPDIGIQGQYIIKKPAKTYLHDFNFDATLISYALRAREAN